VRTDADDLGDRLESTDQPVGLNAVDHGEGIVHDEEIAHEPEEVAEELPPE
jgi:hypothetical protein